MQDTLKDIFGPMFEAILQGEMNGHLGYEVMLMAQKTLEINEMVIQIKLLRQAPVNWE